MSNQLLEQCVRIQTAVTEYVAELRERALERARRNRLSGERRGDVQTA